jgi:CBS domain-containing protein
MTITKCMKRNVASISHHATVLQAAAIFSRRKVGMLPVLDDNSNPIGIVRISDLMELELPDFINLIADLDFVHDFGAVEMTHPDAAQLNQNITNLMQPVISVEENCGLLRAYAMMLQNNLLDLPVIKANGELVGVVSRVDIGSTVLSNWPLE